MPQNNHFPLKLRVKNQQLLKDSKPKIFKVHKYLIINNGYVIDCMGMVR